MKVTPFTAMMTFILTIMVGFFLLYIFDTFIFEPLFESTIIADYVPSAIITLIQYLICFGIPIGLFLRSILDSIQPAGGIQ